MNFYPNISNSGLTLNNNSIPQHFSSNSFQLKYPALKYSRLTLNRDVFRDPILLPYQFDQPLQPISFSHDFSYEVQVLAKLEEETIAEELNQRALKDAQQEAAWRAIEAKRNQNLKPRENTPPITRPSNPETLIDLDFDEETLKRKETSSNLNNNNNNNNKYCNDIDRESPSPKRQKFATADEQALSCLLEMGMNPEISLMAIEIYGNNDLSQLIQFVSDFQTLQEKPEKFSKERIKNALLKFQDYDKALQFLKFSEKFLKKGGTDKMVIDALDLFSKDLKQAENFVLGCIQLTEFGFPYDQMKNALVANGNNIENAIQFCLEKQ